MVLITCNLGSRGPAAGLVAYPHLCEDMHNQKHHFMNASSKINAKPAQPAVRARDQKRDRVHRRLCCTTVTSRRSVPKHLENLGGARVPSRVRIQCRTIRREKKNCMSRKPTRFHLMRRVLRSIYITSTSTSNFGMNG